MPAVDQGFNQPKKKTHKVKPVSPAGDRPQTHGAPTQQRPVSPSGDRPQNSRGDTHRPRRPARPSPAGDRPQTHGPTGTARPASPAGDRPQTHTAKSSKAYVAALQQAYKAQPLAERQRIASAVEFQARVNHNRTAAIIAHLHDQRHAADQYYLSNFGELPRAAYKAHLEEAAHDNAPPTPHEHHSVGDSIIKSLGSIVSVVLPEAAMLRAPKEVKDVVRALNRSRSHAHRAATPTQAEQDAAEAEFRRTGKLPAKLRYGTSTHFPSIVKAGNTLPTLLANDAAALAAGTYHDPVGVPTKTLKQAALATAAAPAAIASLATHPQQTAEAAAKDYAARGSESYKKKLARVRKEGGFAEVADLGTAFSLGGGAASKTALITKAPERAAKLLSGGAIKIPKKGGPVRYFTGRAYDAAKAAKYERNAKRGTPLTALQHEALQQNRAAGRVVAVVPARSGRKIASVVANARGKAVHGLKYDMAKGPFVKLAQQKFKLNKDEAKALWLGTEVGIRDPATASVVGKQLRDKMAAERGDYKPVGWEEDMDVLAQIDEVLKDPEKHFTPKFARTMDAIHEHAQAISADEPQFKHQTKENRRRAVQAYTLGLERGEVSAVDHGDALIREHGSVRDAIKATHPDRGGNADDFRDVRLAAARAGERAAAAKIAAGEARLAKMQPGTQAYESLKRQVEGFYHAQDRHRADQLRTPPELRYAPEADAEFNARVDREAAAAGLAPPTYFRSEKQQGLEPDYASRVVGGSGPKSTGKQYLGKNLRQGIFDTSFDQLVRGYAHNVKATHNYPLIAKLDDKNRLRSFSPDSEPQGAALGDLMNRVNRAKPRVQKGSVVFVNKGLFERAADDPEAPHAGEFDTQEDHAAALQDYALHKSLVTEGEAVDTHLAKTPGWVAWPKEAARELEAELHAGSAGGRTLDIAKGKASQAILLTANVPWLAFQAVSEFGVTGIASKGRALTPRNMIGTAQWWKAMNHRQRTHVATELGLGATGSDAAAIKLGATTNARLVDAWRDFKSADFWHRPRVKGVPISTGINPVKWMRAADQGKTNVTRLLHAHSELTKHISPEGQHALAGALTHMASFGKTADRLLPVMGKPAAEQLDYLLKHPHILEDVGETTSTALGDWTTMTAKERAWANRFVMFYPFVRYSTRLLLHTLPVDHPAVTSVLAELGQMKADEYRQVFGDDDLPWNIGKVYFGKTGESKYIDLSRANPALNAAVSGLSRVGTNSSNIPGAVVGMLPPYGQWLVDHLTGVNTFKGRPLRFNGDTDPFWNKPLDVGLDDHGKLLVAQVQSLFYPAREAMARLHPESQSDESSLLFPTPMQYKKPSEIKGNSQDAIIRRATANNAIANEKFAQQHNGGIADLLLGPLAPHESRDLQSSQERAYVAKLKAQQAKTAAARAAYRASHGGKNPPQPKSPFSGGGRKSPFVKVR